MVKASKDVRGRAVTLKDADAAKFVKAYAMHLKAQGHLQVPTWADLAKTGTQCELAPQDPDWFFTRVASVARQVYIRSGSGIGGLRKRYGGSYQKNCIRPHFQKAAGGPIRKALQALETLKVLEKKVDGGRQITAKGAQDMDRIAAGVVLDQ
ncbi:40S ribosomal protein S19-1 [Diplonema papillatum]|nr:40S ribosomal protein S19-1 [Diplonema papillatum]